MTTGQVFVNRVEIMQVLGVEVEGLEGSHGAILFTVRAAQLAAAEDDGCFRGPMVTSHAANLPFQDPCWRGKKPVSVNKDANFGDAHVGHFWTRQPGIM